MVRPGVENFWDHAIATIRPRAVSLFDTHRQAGCNRNLGILKRPFSLLRSGALYYIGSVDTTNLLRAAVHMFGRPSLPRLNSTINSLPAPCFITHRTVARIASLRGAGDYIDRLHQDRDQAEMKGSDLAN